MLERLQRYVDTLVSIPTEEEYADIIRMSRRGFFGATAALVASPYLFSGDSPLGLTDHTAWLQRQFDRAFEQQMDVMQMPSMTYVLTGNVDVRGLTRFEFNNSTIWCAGSSARLTLHDYARAGQLPRFRGTDFARRKG